MKPNITDDSQYKKWVTELKDKIHTGQIKAAIAVNRELLRLYWELGKEIVNKQQQTDWGTH